MGIVTLHEASKLGGREALRDAIVRTFSNASELVRVFPILDLPGSDTYTWNTEAKLPQVVSRGYNGVLPATNEMKISKRVESMVIVGGEIKTDAILDSVISGRGVHSRNERGLVKSIALEVSRQIIKGDRDNPAIPGGEEFDGLQKRASSFMTFPANLSAPAANSPLSLDAMSKANQELQASGPRAFIVSPDMKRKLNQAARQNLGGDIRISMTEFGFEAPTYEGVPIITADMDAQGNRILDFNEAGPGGGNTSTSIYLVALDSLAGVTLIQNGGLRFQYFDKLETEDAKMTRITWQVGMVDLAPRSFARIWGITDAPVTV